ncbi:Omega-amidase nit3 [Dipsacomyces acuminosporus]|nr:Omega-amidase nit3 [Dipsacomyces acuminosporus]
MDRVRLALIQLKTVENKAQNLDQARKLVLEAAAQGAKIAVLPELFNQPYGIHMHEYAEKIDLEQPGETISMLSKLAKEAQIYLVGGSMLELSEAENSDEVTIYNTSTVWDPNGRLIAMHRKVHLFSIDYKDRKFSEADFLGYGDSATEFSTPYGKFGVAICYDIRFPELAMVAARNGCVGMIYACAFSTKNSPNWDLLARTRSVDNLMFVAACNPALNEDANYLAHGHSMIIDPMARVVATAGTEEAIVAAELDIRLVHQARKSIPIYSHKRFDVYAEIVSKKPAA